MCEAEAVVVKRKPPKRQPGPRIKPTLTPEQQVFPCAKCGAASLVAEGHVCGMCGKKQPKRQQ